MAPPSQYCLPPRRKITDGCAKWVGVLCLTIDKRGPKLDAKLLIDIHTAARVSFVEENPFASDKSLLKRVAMTGQR